MIKEEFNKQSGESLIDRRDMERSSNQVAAQTGRTRGTQTTLPAPVISAIIALLGAVIKSQATTWTTALLLPLALGVVVGMKSAHLLKSREQAEIEGVRSFTLSRMWLWRLCQQQGWSVKKQQFDVAKLPLNWKSLVLDFMLRISYFVFQYDVPLELILNYDHTPIHFIQQKGRTWTTGSEQEKGTKGKGDKRQFTAVLGLTPKMQLPAQLVVEGKTARAMPSIINDTVKYVATESVRWK
eukprot:Pompholyxophrys_punicea_v1_NODE_200_length_2805_cov_13.133406.p1 type:complete len:240 gc:universal NODE_200_length_2805_cov_13.133406:432-1151(+)